MQLRHGVALLAILAWSAHPEVAASESEPPESAADRQALIAFYHATGGPSWKRQDGWLTDAPLDEWHGVGTDWDGRVREIRLKNNNLSGFLPPELGQLARLTWLQLPGNRLVGTISPVLGHLQGLYHLDLRWNDLEGEIPSALGQLHRLDSLLLANNRLSGRIPGSLGELRMLRRLVLSHNQLSGEIPPELGGYVSRPHAPGLTRLQALALDHNLLAGRIPSQLGRLTHLTRLFLQNNALTGSVPVLRSHNLTHLDLTGNRLSGKLPNSSRLLANAKRAALDQAQCPRGKPSTRLNLECGAQDRGRNLTGQHLWDASTIIAIPPDPIAQVELEIMAAFDIVDGRVSMNSDRRPSWLTIEDATSLTAYINEFLDDAGFSIVSASDWERLIETYDGSGLHPNGPTEPLRPRSIQEIKVKDTMLVPASTHEDQGYKPQYSEIKPKAVVGLVGCSVTSEGATIISKSVGTMGQMQSAR